MYEIGLYTKEYVYVELEGIPTRFTISNPDDLKINDTLNRHGLFKFDVGGCDAVYIPANRIGYLELYTDIGEGKI